MEISLAGKVALVTGAGSGIGRAIATVLARCGAAVVVNDINDAGGRATVDSIAGAGGRAVFIHADVADEAACNEMMRRVAAELGDRLDVLVNNAGIELFRTMEEMSVEEWDRVTRVDLKGVFVPTKAALPLLKRPGPSREGATVVHIASVHAHSTLAGQAPYAASKGGIVAMTRAMALELGPMGVNVNSVSPGFIDAPMLQQWFDTRDDPATERQRIDRLHPSGRIGRPEEVAWLVAYLASPFGRFINGTNITIDGGLTARLQH